LPVDPLYILKKYWGYPGFRPMQEDIIRSVLDGKDTLALLPTGGGKSICFQVPGLCLEGTTLVISPLISLMKDQVERLNSLGIPAAFINSAMPYHLIDHKLQQATEGKYRFLYLAPERLKTEMFQLRLERIPVKLLAVDEAHCISQWGYDFRPAYLDIYQLREQLGDIPVLALTASAPPQVQEDIIDKLHLQNAAVFRKSFRRDNLRYFVYWEENVLERMLGMVEKIQGSGIIYARTRKRTESIAHYLQQHGIPAKAYHGGMPYSQRNEIQQKWIDNEYRIIAATNAFGMGIDKSDVRFVIHYNVPPDLESYYQEAGRGGRDGQTALAIAFNNPADLAELRNWSREKYPPFDQVKNHFEGLCKFYRLAKDSQPEELFTLDVAELASFLDSKVLSVYRSLQILSNEHIIQLLEDRDDFGYIQMIARPEDLHIYKSQHPQTADILDFMLRTMGGEVFTQEMRFLPERWARLLYLEEEELLKILNRFKAHSLITFNAPSGQPMIRFHTSYRLLTQEELNWDKYEFLKAQDQQRLQAILSYIQDTKTCRSILIQRYFGEKTDQPCGKCDVCIGRFKQSIDDRLTHDLKNAFMNYIRQHPGVSYKELLIEIRIGTPAQRERVLRYLLDKQIILQSITGTLSLPK